MDNKNRTGICRTWTIPRAQYNRLTKKFGKIDPDDVKDEDLDNYIIYMEQRLSDCRFFADRAARKDDMDSMRKAAMFRNIYSQLSSELEGCRGRARRRAGSFYEGLITFDRNGQGTFNFCIA